VRESEITGINELKICPNNFKVVNFNFPPSTVSPQSSSDLTSDLSLVHREDARKDERLSGGNDSGTIPSLRKKKTPGTQRETTGRPLPYEKLEAAQTSEFDTLLTCPICNSRRVRFECYIMSCPMYDSHKFYCGECTESEHTLECHFDMVLSEQSMSMAAGYLRKQLINAEIAKREGQEKMAGNKSLDMGTLPSQCVPATSPRHDVVPTSNM